MKDFPLLQAIFCFFPLFKQNKRLNIWFQKLVLLEGKQTQGTVLFPWRPPLLIDCVAKEVGLRHIHFLHPILFCIKLHHFNLPPKFKRKEKMFIELTFLSPVILTKKNYYWDLSNRQDSFELFACCLLYTSPSPRD